MRRPVTTPSQIRRNTILLALCLVTLSGVIQLAVAVATITLVLATGIESILGLGPAIFLTAGALAALPAGRLMDRYGRVPVIAGGFVTGAVGCALTALGCLADSAPLVIFGFIGVGAMNGGVLLARTAAADCIRRRKRRGRSPTSSSERSSVQRSARSSSAPCSPGRTSSWTRSSSPGSSPRPWRSSVSSSP